MKIIVAIYSNWDEYDEVFGVYADETALLADLMDRGAEKFSLEGYRRAMEELRKDGSAGMMWTSGAWDHNYGERLRLELVELDV